MARVRFAAGVLVGAAVLRLLAGPGLVNYDTLYTLVWGRQLAHGVQPDLEVAIAPTPHPLANLGATLLSPLSSLQIDGLHGEPAAIVVVALAYISLALLGWVVFALGREWFNAAAGALAAAIVLTRVPVLDFGARAYVDISFLVLVLGALLVETRRPRAGGPVLALLALAGLVRPEAWLFSAAYLAWLLAPGLRAAGRARPRRAPAWRDVLPLVALAASAPLLWALHDLLLTGDPLHSLTGTRDNAELLGRVTGIEHVPAALPRRLGEILREPVLLLAAGGGLLALAWRRDRHVRLGAQAGLLAAGAFCLLAAAGLPIITRYLLLTATLLAIFAGAGAFGWLDLAPGRERTWWARFAALGLVALLAFVPSQAQRIDRLGAALARQEAIQGKLGEIAGDDAGLTQPVAVPNRRPIPLLALWLNLDPRAIVNAQDGLPPRGTYLRPATAAVARDYILDRRDRDKRVAPPPPGWVLLRGNDAWRAFHRP
jgi:hypothetical protein